MFELGDGLRLLDELRLIGIHHLGITLRAQRYVQAIGIAVVVLLREELLDAHHALCHDLLGKVCDAETTLTKSGYHAILPILEICSSL